MTAHRTAAVLLLCAALAGCGDDAADRVGSAAVSREPSPAASSPSPARPSASASPTATPTPSPSAAPAPAEPALGPGSRIGVEGVGAVRAGMTVREAEQVTGLVFTVEGFEDFDGYCYSASPAGLGERVTLLVVADDPPADPKDGVIGRASVYEGMADPAPTVSGVRIGDPVARVRAVYGDRLTESEHEYQEDGAYLDVVPRDAALDGFLLRVVVGDEGTVEEIHGGRRDVVSYVEGCA